MTNQTDVRKYIDEHPLGRRQYLVFFVLFLTFVTDGIDTQITSYLASSIAREWGISMAGLGLVFSMGLAGSGLGALVFGALGDWLGLKRVSDLGAVARIAPQDAEGHRWAECCGSIPAQNVSLANTAADTNGLGWSRTVRQGPLSCSVPGRTGTHFSAHRTIFFLSNERLFSGQLDAGPVAEG